MQPFVQYYNKNIAQMCIVYCAIFFIRRAFTMSQYYVELAESAVLRKRERGFLRIALLLYAGIPGLDFK